MELQARQNTPNSGQNATAAMRQQNAQARAAILAIAQNMVQNVYTNSIATVSSSTNVLQINPRLVGFLKRFWVEVSCTITNNDDTNDLTITPWGPANLLSGNNGCQFNDLSNNIRIQTAGWHLHAVASAKRGRPFGCSYLTDSPVGFGSNWNVIKAPSTISHGGGTGTVYMMYEVPIAYNDTDFRGGIWLGVTNATATLQLTFNTAAFVASGSDPTLAMYSGSTNATITNLTINVYQNYLDQLPQTNQGTLLPINDIATVYLLNNTTQPNIVANQDNPIPYANFRDFLSTFAIFDNGGTLNAGSDVNYWAIQAANYVNTWKTDPNIPALYSRNMVNVDWPIGTYYFNSRWKPISTMQYGNQELVLNPSSVNSGAKVYMGYEMFALVNLVAQSGALAIG